MAKKKMESLVPVEEQPYKVPENWRWVFLGAVIELISGRDASLTECNSEGRGIPYILGASNIIDNHFLVERWIERPQVVARKGDILLSVKGTIGKLYLQQEEAINISRQIMSIRPDQKLSTRFVFLFLTYICDELRETGNGLIPGISRDDILYKPFPLLPFMEQERIADCIENLFAKLDEAKEKAQAVVDGFEDRKAAILYRAMAGDLTEQWRKESNISRDQWEIVHLKDVCRINPPKVDTKNLQDDLEVSFFPMPALSEVSGEITEPQIRKLVEVKTGFTNFSEGDVVFAKITPCMENGKSAVIGSLVNGIGFGTTEFYVMRCGEKLFNRFLWHMVRARAFREKAKGEMTGAVGQQRVPKGYLEEYEFECPPVEEQLEIVRLLDAAFDNELQVKQTAEATIEQIDMMKKSILAKAFRGELGTNDPSEPPVELS